MNKDIFLRNANYRIIANNWEDKKDEIIEKVKEDFRKYTSGTHRDYRNADKLCYLDLLREKLDDRDYNDIKRDCVIGRYDYECEYGLIEDKFEIEFDDDFGEFVFEESKKPFYKSGKKASEHNLIALIIKTVMDWER